MRVTRSPPVPHPHPRPLDDRLQDWRRASRVSIYNEEAVRISRFVMAYPNLETGGDLFGFWTNSGAPVVSYVIGPGRYSTHCYASFYQDADWLHEAGTGLYDCHGLQHIGEWHSHHRLGLNQPSPGDIRTVVRGMAAKNWSKFVLMIATRDATEGSPVLQSYYLVNPYGDYKPLRIRALPGRSPFRTGPNNLREEPFQGPVNLGLVADPPSTAAPTRRAEVCDGRQDDDPTGPPRQPMSPAGARLSASVPPHRGRLGLATALCRAWWLLRSASRKLCRRQHGRSVQLGSDADRGDTVQRARGNLAGLAKG